MRLSQSFARTISKVALLSTGYLIMPSGLAQTTTGTTGSGAVKAALPKVSMPAPLFSLIDINGNQQSLSDFKGKNVALFFLCGCSQCAECLREWSNFQRGGALKELNSKNKIQSLTAIVFAGDKTSTKDFTSRNGLPPATAILLPDADMEVSAKIYHAVPCPRVFVLDQSGILRFTNKNPGIPGQEVPGAVVAFDCLTALRSVTQPRPIR